MSTALRFPLNLHGFIAISMLLLSSAIDAADARKTPPPPVYLAECAACHAAFLPRMLPATSWQRLMRTLPQHFGTDASLDATTAKEIEAWLVGNAAAAKRVVETPPEDRISRSRWFTRQHDEISSATWQRPAIKSRSNCSACHRTSDQGVFDEHDVRIPK